MAVVTTLRPTRKDVDERAERRERMVRAMASEALNGLLYGGVEGADQVVAFADELLDALDRRRDADLHDAA